MAKPFSTAPSSLPKTITKLALPSVVAMSLSALTNLAATLFAMPQGQETVAAMGIVFSALSLMQAFGYTIALGGSTLLSPLLGKDRSTPIAPLCTITLRLAAWVGAGLALVGVLFITPLTKLLGATPSLFPLCTAYGKPLFLSAPFVCTNLAFTCFLRCVNRSGKAMIGLVAGGVVTIALTPWLLSVFSPGIQGAGVAFLLGQSLSFVLLFLFYRKIPGVSPPKEPIPLRYYWQIPYYGMASFLRQGLACVSLILLNRQAQTYGTTVLSALSVGSRVSTILYSALLGWGQGFAPFAGYSFGKQEGKNLLGAFSFSYKIAFWGSCVATLVLLPLSLFLSAPSTKLCLLSTALSLPFLPLGVLITMGYQSVKRPLPSSLLSLLRQGICLIPLLFFLPHLWQEKGLLIAQGVADLLTFLLCLWPYRRFRRFCLAFQGKK